MNARVLLFGSSDGILGALAGACSAAGLQPQCVSSLEDAGRALRDHSVKALVWNTRSAAEDMEWLRSIRENRPDLILVVVTPDCRIENAVAAMQSGADNYIVEPTPVSGLLEFLQHELAVAHRPMLRRGFRPEFVHFGESPAMQRLREYAEVAARSDAHVLITGPTGTGKGVLAKWIHGHGRQARQPFVEVNCASLRGELLRSELFGHAKGSFTSASRDRKGLIEEADQGTLFLDEIGDMDFALQSQFLKAIEDRTFRRLGETQMRSSEFRLICATNSDLAARVRQGRFRRDLYYRICIFPIAMPPLRDHREDLPELSRFILSLLRNPPPEISPEALTSMQEYAWPGNVRELRNRLEQALILSRGGAIDLLHLPDLHALRLPAEDEITSLQSAGDLHIRKVIEAVNGDPDEASRRLGISTASLQRRLYQSL